MAVVSLSDRCQEVASRADTHHLAMQTEPTEHGWSGAVLLCCHIGWDGFFYQLRQVCHWSWQCCQSRGLPGDPLLTLAEEGGWVMWNMPLKTSVSLRSHQIYTVLPYSRSAVWQKRIMRTSCGWHGDTGSCNNCPHRKMETNQMYQQEINNWKLLILVLCAPQSSDR